MKDQHELRLHSGQRRDIALCDQFELPVIESRGEELACPNLQDYARFRRGEVVLNCVDELLTDQREITVHFEHRMFPTEIERTFGPSEHGFRISDIWGVAYELWEDARMPLARGEDDVAFLEFILRESPTRFEICLGT